MKLMPRLMYWWIFVCIISFVSIMLQHRTINQMREEIELLKNNNSFLLKKDKCYDIPLKEKNMKIVVKNTYPLNPDVKKKIDKITEFFSKTEYAPVIPIILAMSVKETGWYSSEQHLKYNNLFSTTRKPNSPNECGKGRRTDCLINHVSDIDCLKTVLGTFRKKGYSTDPHEFIKDLVKYGWAEDKTYTHNLWQIIESLEKRGYINRNS